MNGPPTTFVIDNRVETVTFDAWIIGHSSSRKDDSTHWTEITIYETVGGNFVYHSAGHSSLYHLTDRPCSRGRRVTGVEIEADEDADPCTRCNPEPWPLDIAAEKLEFLREITLSEVHTIKDAEHLRNLMYYERGGAKHVSSLATAALNMALDMSPAFADMIKADRPAPRRIS